MVPLTRTLILLALWVALTAGAAAQDLGPTASELPPITPGNASGVRQIGAVPLDVRRVVLGPGPGRVSLLGWGTPVDVRDARTLMPVRRLAAEQQLIGFAAAPDGTTVAWCENAFRVEVRNLRTGKSVVLDVGSHQPTPAFSPDSQLLATGGYGTKAKLWDVASGLLVWSFDVGPVEGGLTPVFSPDGRLLAVGHRNAETRVFETASGKLRHVLPRKMSQELRFSPDGRVLAVAYVDGGVGLWDVATGRLLRARRAVAQEVYTLDWSPAGDVLATAGRNGPIILWDPRDLRAVKELEAPEWVIQVRFSPDGTRLFTAGGTIRPPVDRKLSIWGLPPAQ